jgi:steroid delta-isomerase-like uncharacterized protein
LALLQKFSEGFSTLDVDLFIAGMVEQVEWVLVPTGEIIRGKQEIASSTPKTWEMISDRKVKLVSMFATEDWGCFEYIASGTITKHPPRYPDSLSLVGKTFELPACLVFHLTDGKIDLIREYFDLSSTQR